MSSLRARVKNGRLILDEPTSLPEGDVIDLVADDQGDRLGEKEREVLHAALAKSTASADAGQLHPVSKILGELRRRR